MNKARIFSIAGILITVLLLTGTVAQAAGLTKIATNHSFGSPRAMGNGLYDPVSNKTYVAWNGPDMDIYIRAYNHATQGWEAALKVKDNSYTGKWDYHNYPVLIIAPNGKLQIYYAQHTTKAFVVTAPNPNSIAGTWTTQTISTDQNGYPMPVVAGNDIYVFYSKNDEVSYPYRTFRYIKSTNNGGTWSSPVTVIDSGKQDPNRFDEVYANEVKYDKDRNRILMSWKMSGGPHGHDKQSKDLHFAYLDIATNTMRSIGGSSLGGVVNYSEFTQTRVFSSTPGDNGGSYADTHNVYGGTFDWIGNGNPVIAFGYYNIKGDGSKKSYFYSWNGTGWTISTISTTNAALSDLERMGTLWDDFRVIIGDSGNPAIKHIYKTTNASSFSIEDSFTMPLDNSANRANYTDFIEGAPVGSKVQIVFGECGSVDPNNYTRGIWSVYVYGN
ncbi:BNR-4 repeat-containing protein [Paenibacillus sp. PL2-23]|uniref:BNR-4 repeat-containing protein n=1 Tax=Paenibacillus sp. PL2-23 TaxID=2100729 RepID=UPI0030F70140